MTAVRVRAPARLHLGLLDVAGRGARRFGGLGVALERPAVTLTASRHDELVVEGPDAERALQLARRFRDALGVRGGARVRIDEAIPAHVGLGSGTKLALAVGQALAAVHELGCDPATLTAAAGRGGRSAVGTWTFARGGFVVEGGVRAGAEPPGPLLARHAMPEDWRCVLVVPDSDPGLSGIEEKRAFHRLTPDPGRAASVAHLVLTSVLPALADGELQEFGAALTRLQRQVGEQFSAIQNGPYHPASAALVEALLERGAAGAGQSSWGPAVFGLAGDEEQGRALAGAMAQRIGGAGWVEVVGFDNRGALVEAACASS